MNLGTLTATLKLNARGFSGPVRGAQKDLANTTTAAGRAGAAMGRLAGRLGALGAAYFGAAAAARQLSSVIQTTRELEFVLTRVGAVSQATAADMQMLGDAARRMGATTTFTAREAGEAMQYMAMAGQDATAITQGLPAVLQLATAGAVGLGEAADTVTNIMAGYGKGAGELGRVNDVLVATFTGSNTALADLGEAFKTVGPMANQLGISIEETAAAIGVLGNAGEKGSGAGTGLRRSLSALLSQSNEVQKGMEALGLEADDAGRGFISLVEKLERMKATMSSEEFQGRMFQTFGQFAGPRLAILVEQGSESLRKLKDRIDGSDGLASAIERSQLDTLDGDLKLAASASDALKEALGDRLNPMLRGIAKAAAEAANALTWMLTREEQEMQAQEQMNIAEAYREQYKALRQVADAGALVDKGEIDRLAKMRTILDAASKGLIKFAGNYDEDFKRALGALGKQARDVLPSLKDLAPSLDGVKTAVAGGAAEWVNYSESVAATTRELKMLLGEVRQISAGEFEDMLRAASGVERITRQEFMGYSYASPFRLGGAKGLARLPEKERFQWAEGLEGGEGGEGAGGGVGVAAVDAIAGGLASAGGFIGGKIGAGIGSALTTSPIGGAIGEVVGGAIGNAVISAVSGGLSFLVEALANAAGKLQDMAGQVYAGLVQPSIGRALPTGAARSALSTGGAIAGIGFGAPVVGAGLGAPVVGAGLGAAGLGAYLAPAVVGGGIVAGSAALGMGPAGAAGAAAGVGLVATPAALGMAPAGAAAGVAGLGAGAVAASLVGLAAAAGAAGAGLLALGAESEKAEQFYQVLDIAKGVLAEAAGGIYTSMLPAAGAFLEVAHAVGPVVAIFADVSGAMPLFVEALKLTAGTTLALGEAGALTARAFADATRRVAEALGQDDIAANALAFREEMTATVGELRAAQHKIGEITTGSAAQEALLALLEQRAEERVAIAETAESFRQLNEQLVNVPGVNIRHAIYRADEGIPAPSPVSVMFGGTFLQGPVPRT